MITIAALIIAALGMLREGAESAPNKTESRIFYIEEKPLRFKPVPVPMRVRRS